MEVRRFRATDLDRLRDTLVTVYAEIYADRLDDPFFAVGRFEERLTGHVAAPNWETAVGYDGEQPIGYAYGASLRADTTFWQRVTPTPDPDFAHETGHRTFFLYELMLRVPWRKTGASRLIHDALVGSRPEVRVALTVEHNHPKVRALYETWAYTHVGTSRPSLDAPIYDAMVLDLKKIAGRPVGVGGAA